MLDKKLMGERLKKIREDRGYSRRGLAKAAGLSEFTLTKWEQGLVSPRLDALMELADFYGLSIDEMIVRTD